MFKYLSQLVETSMFLQTWSGRQTSTVLTSNSKVIAYKEFYKDSLINSVLLKVLFTYDLKAFYEVINQGVEFVYQSKVYQLKTLRKGLVSLTIYGYRNKKQVIEYQGTLTNKSMSEINLSYLNRDILDVLTHLIQKGLNH